MPYQSRVHFLGLPLIDIGLAGRGDTSRRIIARGWIAVGDIAVGVLFAAGGVAIGAISVGGLGIGALVVAGVALGIAPVGGLAAGLYAFGGAAFGWVAAVGGLAVARDWAVGGSANAVHANDPVALQYFRSNVYFQAVDWGMRNRWIVAPVVLPLLLLRTLRRHSRRARDHSERR
jgi:hypothetical protein